MRPLKIYRGDDDMDTSPVATLGVASALGAVFGLGALVHDRNAVLSVRTIVGVLLYSAGNSFIAGACWHLYVDPNPLGAVMMAASAGLFGLPAKTLLALVFKKTGIVSIRFNGDDKTKDKDAA